MPRRSAPIPRAENTSLATHKKQPPLFPFTSRLSYSALSLSYCTMKNTSCILQCGVHLLLYRNTFFLLHLLLLLLLRRTSVSKPRRNASKVGRQPPEMKPNNNKVPVRRKRVISNAKAEAKRTTAARRRIFRVVPRKRDREENLLRGRGDRNAVGRQRCTTKAFRSKTTT